MRMSFLSSIRAGNNEPLTVAVLGATPPEIDALHDEFSAAYPGRLIEVRDYSLSEFLAVETDKNLRKVHIVRPADNSLSAQAGRGFAVIDGGLRKSDLPPGAGRIADRRDTIFGQRFDLF